MLIILFFLLLAANFLLRKILQDVKIKSEKLSFIHRYFPVLELIVWAVVIIWASNNLVSNTRFHLYVNFLTVTLGFVLISWFFIKDYISGIQIKSRFLLSSGQNIRCAQANGTIKKMGLLLMEVKSENGSDFKIPYSQIDQKSIEINFREKGVGEKSIKIVLSSKLKSTDTIQKIMELVVNSPWSSYKSPPVINVTEMENDLVCYEISCVTVGANGNKRLKELIQKAFPTSKTISS